MVAVVDALPVRVPSETVSVTVYVPLSAYTWLTCAPVAVGLPSPKSHRYDRASPSGSVDAPPPSATAVPSVPVTGGPATATGARFVLIKLKISAALRLEALRPPAIRARPSTSRVVVWSKRAAASDAAGEKVPDATSYTST